jgi:hypothetical protein
MESPGGLLQPVRKSETATAAKNCPRQIFINASNLFAIATMAADVNRLILLD